MGAEAIMKAAQKKVALEAAVGLLTKRAEPKDKRVKGASAKVVLKLVKSASDKGIEKKALLGNIGKWLMMLGGKGLKGIGGQVGKLHAGAGGAISRAGSGLKRRAGLAEMAMRMKGMKGGVPTLEHLTGRQTMSGALPVDKADKLTIMLNRANANPELASRLAGIAPEARKALGTSRIVGGAAGLGGLAGLLSLGGEKKEPQIPPELMLALAQARMGAQGAQ